MDLYKWAFQLSPLIPSEIVMDCFDLAAAIREVDMRASPYDLSDLGYQAIPVETTAGRAEYVRHQRAFTARGSALRTTLLERTQSVLADVATTTWRACPR